MQATFTVLAFLAMFISSYIFIGNTIRSNLVRNMESMFYLWQEHISIATEKIGISEEELWEYMSGSANVQGCIGMVLSEDLDVLVHPNPYFIGLNIRNPKIPVSVFADDLLAGVDISGRVMYHYITGGQYIVFLRQLPNGKYLGFAAPKNMYYERMTENMLFLGIISVIFALVLIVGLLKIDMARRNSDEEKKRQSAFLANMSHEIRTPMNAIIGMSSIGKNANAIERKDYCFSKIEDASKHLLGLINDVLDMAKIAANKMELHEENFDFEKMLQRVVNMITFSTGQKQQDLSVKIDCNIPTNLIGDDHRLAQVITNLLSNATKFTPEGGKIHLEVSLLGEENDNCTILFKVKDSGIGMSKEQLSKLFTSFQQAEVSTSRRFGGTGLGLVLVKSFVEMMGGKVNVESELGSGATFSFTLVMKRGEGARKTFYGGVKSNIKILAVDDDPDAVEYVKEILSGFGISCDTALCGAEALDIVNKNGAYDIYIIDWKMPDIDGIALSDKLKDGGFAESDKSVVILISSTQLSEIEWGTPMTLDRFLQKPLFPSALIGVLDEFLGTEQSQPITEVEFAKSVGYFSGYRVLLVEDVLLNCEIFMALFEEDQIEVECAENGIKAIEKFTAAPEKYDLILMDVQMPEMDGYEATKRIRAMSDIPQAKTVPIIAMTANVFREDIERCLKSGMNDHVAKPLDYDIVFEKLRKYLPNKT